MNLNLQSSDFELFALPERFAQDRPAIDARWKELQREVHPDKFAAQGQAAQRMAMQWSVRVNEAYQRLKDPLKRAAYLCELRGSPINAEDNTAMPAQFLVEQMQWREALDEAASSTALEALDAQLSAARKHALRCIEQALDETSDPRSATQNVRALMFIERFAQDLRARFAQLEQ
jgi:molecular chaperone HscB